MAAAKEQFPRRRLTAVAAILIAGLLTVLLTRPAETAVSFTPLSGLMTLKATAAEAVPYEVAIANPKPTLIEFYADWCTTCQAMSPTVAALHQQYAERLNFVMLDVDRPQWASQVSDYGASGVPQFTLLDSEQQVVKTWVGKVPKAVFKTVFDQILG
ncbi:thioredoxin domain-containing protein [Vasconcelosia minhoensis]|nr:thioredoxin domain-containing protein [Romeria gracilis]